MNKKLIKIQKLFKEIIYQNMKKINQKNQKHKIKINKKLIIVNFLILMK